MKKNDEKYPYLIHLLTSLHYYYRGIRDIEFIWHGPSSDSEISYNGMVVNFYDVEDTIWQEYKEDGHDSDDEEEFTKYCQRHEADIKSLITDIWITQKN